MFRHDWNSIIPTSWHTIDPLLVSSTSSPAPRSRGLDGHLALCDPRLSAVLLLLGPGHQLPNILPSRNRGARSMSAIKPLLDRILTLRHKHPTYERIARTHVYMYKGCLCVRNVGDTSCPSGSKRVAFARKSTLQKATLLSSFLPASFNFAREASPKFIRIRWISPSSRIPAGAFLAIRLADLGRMVLLESLIIAIFDSHRDYCHPASESVVFSQKIWEHKRKKGWIYIYIYIIYTHIHTYTSSRWLL